MIKRLTNTLAVDSYVCHAFGTKEAVPVGSVVTNHADFLAHLEFGMKTAEFDEGVAFIILPETAWELVQCGDGLHTHEPGDYISARHRGHVDSYLRRDLASKTRFLAVVVYTTEAYATDPEVSNEDLSDEDAKALEGIEHVIVTVIASAFDAAPFPIKTLVNNISGNNAKFLLETTPEEATKLHEEKTKVLPGSLLERVIADAHKAHGWAKAAKSSMKFWSEHAIVAG